MRVRFLIIGLFLFNISLFANTGEETHYYKGRIDDVNDIAVTLTFKGKKCNGVMTYLRSNTTFLLEGYKKGQKLTLQEIDQEEAISGYINAIMSDDIITGNWQNYNNTIGGTLYLEEVSKAVDFPSYCGDNKWIHLYHSVIGNNKIELILQKQNNAALTGIAYIEGRAESYKIEGKIEENSQVFIISLTGNITHEKIGELEGTYKKRKAVTAIFTELEDEKTFMTLSPQKTLNTGCIEYADYITTYDFLYPKNMNAAFNEQMKELTKSWVEDCNAQALKVRQEHGMEIPALRSTVRAYAWTHLEWLSDDMISGYLTFTNTWNSKAETKSFIFDLVQNKLLSEGDIFKKDFDYNHYIKKSIREKIKNHPDYKDQTFRQWLVKQSFSKLTIRKTGLCLSTNFDAIYGKQSILIPFKEIKSHLDENYELRIR